MVPQPSAELIHLRLRRDAALVEINLPDGLDADPLRHELTARPKKEQLMWAQRDIVVFSSSDVDGALLDLEEDNDDIAFGGAVRDV